MSLVLEDAKQVTTVTIITILQTNNYILITILGKKVILDVKSLSTVETYYVFIPFK
jgi:hypothetical protein